MVVEQNSGLILGHMLSVPSRFHNEFKEDFFKHIAEKQCIPAQIHVEKKEVFQFFKPIADSLNIKISLVKEFKELGMARNGMINFFSR